MNGIRKLIQEASKRSTDRSLNIFRKANEIKDTVNDEQVSAMLSQTEEYVYGLCTGRNFSGKPVSYEKVNLSEMLTTDDVSVVLPRVVNTILQEPQEPAHFLMQNVAEMVVLGPNDPVSIEFPSLGSLMAGQVGEGQDYPHVTAALGRNMVSMRLKKYGLMSTMSEELQRQSIYPLIAMHVRMGRQAVDRKLESILYDTMVNEAKVIFDNQSTDASYHTTGKDSAQAKNYTFSYYDLVKMSGVIVGNRYQPSHVLAHPLSWGVMAMDPFLRAQFMHNGQIGGNIWNRGPEFDQGAVTPFNLTYVPYYPLTYRENTTLTGPGSGAAATLLTDLYVIDRANSLYMATMGETEVDDMEDFYKDGRTIKVRRYADAAAKDQGKGMTAAKYIRNERNFEPIMTVQTVS